jgi:D-aminoacyl-tRNA deacylase
MRAVIQLVKQASVRVNDELISSINNGLLVLLGISEKDTEKDAQYMLNKIIGLRIFADNKDKMNLSVKDVNGEIMIVSQFTLYGDCRKGKRPSYSKAASPAKARKLYEYFLTELAREQIETATGIFKEMMEVSLINNGPVTIMLDSEKNF